MLLLGADSLCNHKHFAGCQERAWILADLWSLELGLELPNAFFRHRDLDLELVIKLFLVDSVSEPAGGVDFALRALGQIITELTQGNDLGLNTKGRHITSHGVIVVLAIDVDLVQQASLAQQTMPQSFLTDGAELGRGHIAHQALLMVASPGLAAVDIVGGVGRDDTVVKAIEILAHELVQSHRAELTDGSRGINGLVVVLCALTELDLVGTGAEPFIAIPFGKVAVITARRGPGESLTVHINLERVISIDARVGDLEAPALELAIGIELDLVRTLLQIIPGIVLGAEDVLFLAWHIVSEPVLPLDVLDTPALCIDARVDPSTVIFFADINETVAEFVAQDNSTRLV